VGFRDEIEAGRARIETLERALSEKQLALEAMRAELDVERASHVHVPFDRRQPDLQRHRAEIERVKARLASAEAECNRLRRGLLPGRRRAVVLGILVLALLLQLAVAMRGGGPELVLGFCRDAIRHHDEMRRTCE
jgi:hypothetical protein